MIHESSSSVTLAVKVHEMRGKSSDHPVPTRTLLSLELPVHRPSGSRHVCILHLAHCRCNLLKSLQDLVSPVDQ